MRRKLIAASGPLWGVIFLSLIGLAAGQPPAPAPQPKPVPQPAPQPTPVAIEGDTSVPCYGFARLRLSGSYTSAGWLCFPDRTTGAALVSTYTTPNGHVYVFGGAPGAYDVGAFAQTPTGIVTMQTVVTIQPAVPVPQPVPTPTPTPVPTPTPGPRPLPGPNPSPNPPGPTPAPVFPSTQRQAFPTTSVERGVARG